MAGKDWERLGKLGEAKQEKGTLGKARKDEGTLGKARWPSLENR